MKPSRRRTRAAPLLVSLVVASRNCLRNVVAASNRSDSLPVHVGRHREPLNPQLRSYENEIISSILSKVQEWQRQVPPSASLPFVTLSYAQSLDGCLALRDPMSEQSSSNLPLSGPESLRLTHGLRSIHDAILVGGNTFAIDNPRLNVRLWPPTKGGNGDESPQTPTIRQPRPVILDTELKSLSRFQANKKKETLSSVRAHNPILCCAQDIEKQSKDDYGPSLLDSIDILPCKRDASGKGLDLKDVLRRLREERDIQSVMVEGGASVLASFANQRCSDCICITIAPKLIGGKVGINAFAEYDTRYFGKSDKTNMASMPWCIFDNDDGGEDCCFVPGLGADCIFLARWTANSHMQ